MWGEYGTLYKPPNDPAKDPKPPEKPVKKELPPSPTRVPGTEEGELPEGEN